MSLEKNWKIRHMSKKIDIISLYLSDYTKGFSVRSIAKLAGMSPQTALNHLNKMPFLRYEYKGKNKEFYLDLKDLRIMQIVKICELSRSMNSPDELRMIMSDMIGHTETIIVYGSFAKGTFDRYSDIDMLLVGRSDKKKINAIKRRYNREINVEFVGFADFKRLRNALWHEIRKNHLIFGDMRVIEAWI